MVKVERSKDCNRGLLQLVDAVHCYTGSCDCLCMTYGTWDWESSVVGDLDLSGGRGRDDAQALPHFTALYVGSSSRQGDYDPQ